MAEYPILSYPQAVAIGRESTYGTQVSRTAAMQLKPGSTFRTYDMGRKPTEELGRHGDVAFAPHRYFDAVKRTGLTLRYTPQYLNASIPLLVDALGVNATTGSGPYIHTARLSAAWPTTGATGHQGLTIEALLGRETTTPANYRRIYNGCRTTKYTWSMRPGEEAMVSQEMVAQTVDDMGTGSNFASLWQSAANQPILHGHLASNRIVWNSINITGIRSLQWSIDWQLTERAWLGLAYLAPPVRGRPVIRVEAEIELTDTNIALMEDYEDMDSSDLTFTMDGPSTLEQAYTFHNCVIVEPFEVSGSPEGVQTVRMVWGPRNDHTSYGVAIGNTNGNTNYYDPG